MIYSILINSVAIFVTAWLLDGVKVKSYFTALGVAVILAIINAFLRPLIIWITLPLTIITLGLFVLVINAMMLMLADAIVEGFEIRNFSWALIFSILLAIVNGLLVWIL